MFTVEGNHLLQSADTFVLIAALGTNLTELQWGGEDREQLTALKPHKDTMEISMGNEKGQKTFRQAMQFEIPEVSAKAQCKQLSLHSPKEWRGMSHPGEVVSTLVNSSLPFGTNNSDTKRLFPTL